MLDYILDRLKQPTTKYLTASQLGQDIRKKDNFSDALDRACGWKAFCFDHDDKIEWIDDGGGGTIHLVKSGSIPVGSKVCIKAEKPACGWGVCSLVERGKYARLRFGAWEPYGLGYAHSVEVCTLLISPS